MSCFALYFYDYNKIRPNFYIHVNFRTIPTVILKQKEALGFSNQVILEYE